jgi:hypothetical protein
MQGFSEGKGGVQLKGKYGTLTAPVRVAQYSIRVGFYVVIAIQTLFVFLLCAPDW